MGQSGVKPTPLLSAICDDDIRKAPGRTEFQRGVIQQQADGSWHVKLTGNQGSGILSSMSEANCFVVLSEACGNVAAGALVQVQLLEGLI
jgi:molybdopterin molybdotransferase